jgi:hypothetical protein
MHVRAALHVQHAGNRNRDACDPDAKRGEEAIVHAQSSRAMRIISSWMCGRGITVPAKMWVSRPTFPLYRLLSRRHQDRLPVLFSQLDGRMLLPFTRTFIMRSRERIAKGYQSHRGTPLPRRKHFASRD